MAKSGYIKIPDATEPGDNALADAVVKSEAPTMNLGALAALVLASSAEAIALAVDFTARKVVTGEAGSGTDLVASGASIMATLTRVEEGGALPKTAWWDADLVAGHDDPAGVLLEAIVGNEDDRFRPRRTVASLLSAIEDGVAAAAPGTRYIAVVDQDGDGSVMLFSGTTIVDPSEGQAVIEQVLETSTTVERQAFE